MTRAAANAAVLFTALASSAVAYADVHRYAIAIGANEGERDEVVLRYAESDAQRIARVLRTVGGFHAEDVLVLAESSATDLRRALIALNEHIRQVGGQSLLLVFYSGHADSEALHLNGTKLPVTELRGLVAGSSASARVLVIDACRSGAVTRVKGGRRAPSFDVQMTDALGAEGFAILSSSAAGEDSQESDQLGASFFTHYLASALIGAADQNQDGQVTLDEAFAYAAERTLVATAGTMAGPQHPTYRLDLGGRDDLVLSRPGSPTEAQAIVEFTQPGWYLVRRGAKGIVAELQSDSGPRRLVLDAGRYHITQRATDHLLEADIVLTAGVVTVLDPHAMERVDYARVVRKGGTQRRLSWSTFVDAGVRGEILGLGTAWRTGVGARLDLPFATFELRLDTSGSDHTHQTLTTHTYELAGTLAALRAFDLGRVVLSLGLEAGGAWFAQRFDQPNAPPRNIPAFVFGPVAQLQIPITRRIYARIDGAALIYVLPTGNTPSSATISTPITYSFDAGLGIYY